MSKWLPAWTRDNSLTAYLIFIAPEIEDACETIHRAIDMSSAKAVTASSDQLVKLLFETVAPKLIHAIERTLILETNIARLHSKLSGDSGYERFLSFLELIKTPEVRSQIHGEYPELQKIVRQILDFWVKNSLSFVQNLSKDWLDLGRFLSTDENFQLGKLTDIKASGDTHNFGKQVLILKFSCGSSLVYKPRDLSVDLALSSFLEWLNPHLEFAPLRIPKVLWRSDYSWVECIASSPCHSPLEITLHHRRLGAWLAVFYVLGGTDFHHENLIGDGAHPVPVDLETVFHPRVSGYPATEHGRALEVFGDTCLMVGILPRPVLVEGVTVDASGAGLDDGLSGFRVPALQSQASDEVAITRKRSRSNAAQNRVHFNTASIHAWDYTVEIEEGFRDVYNCLLESRNDLLSPEGVLEPFKNVEVRVVVRPTMQYVPLLIESYHPTLLRDALSRPALFNHLQKSANIFPPLKPFVDSEKNQLALSDVPAFYANTQSTIARGGDGKFCENAFDRTGLGTVESRLKNLSVEDCERQCWLIRGTFAASAAAYSKSAKVKPSASSPCRSPLDVAILAGDMICRAALQTEKGAHWLTFNHKADPTNPKRGHYEPGLVGYDLYDGLPGTILFLATLGSITQDNLYRSLAEKALFTLEEGWIQRPEFSRPGFFSGVGGMVLTWRTLGELWEREDLIQKANVAADRLVELSAQSSHQDIIAGNAGDLATFVALYKDENRSQWHDAIRACVAKICEASESTDTGMSWPSMPFKMGFAHGVSGVAWALSEAAHITGDKNLAVVSCRSLLQEQRTIDTGMWTDRDEPGKPAQATWCHGAAGMSLALSALSGVSKESWLAQDLERSVNFTISQMKTLATHGACHGSAGNLEILSSCLRNSPNLSKFSQTVARLTEDFLEDVSSNGIKTSLPGQIFSPGFMTGVAGIGHSCLKIQFPDKVRSILKLGL